MTFPTKLALLTLLICLSHQAKLNDIDDNFDTYQKNQGKHYGSNDEAAYRAQIFRRNVDAMRQHNAKPDVSYKQDVNQFTDMTPSEFKRKTYAYAEKMLLPPGQAWMDEEMKKNADPIVGATSSRTSTTSTSTTTSNSTTTTPVVGLSTSVDWTNIMNPVKDQGQCGSCWTFAAVATLESGLRIRNGTSRIFSEQELVDCCDGDLNSICSVSQGCNGGSTIQAYNYVAKYGISNSSYTYTAAQGTCKNTSYVKTKMLKTNGTYTTVASNNLNYFKGNLTMRPLTIYIDANSWQFYSVGIFTGCTYAGANHAVTAVGYDSSGNWKIRNSWGTSWGESGYIRIAPNNSVDGGACGVLKFPYIPNFL